MGSSKSPLTSSLALAERIYGSITAPAPVVRTPNGPNLLSNGSFEDAELAAGTSAPTMSIEMNGWEQTGTNPELVNLGGVFDRTGDDFLAMSQVSSLFQVAQEIQGDRKYTFLVDYGYSVHWFNLADGAFAALADRGQRSGTGFDNPVPVCFDPGAAEPLIRSANGNGDAPSARFAAGGTEPVTLSKKTSTPGRRRCCRVRESRCRG